VRQEQLGEWFGVAQEHVSRFNGYWLAGDWADLLSLKTAEVLTHELVARIVTVCATFPHWTGEQVYAYLHQQGVNVSQAQVEQAAEQSGWGQLQATLKEKYRLTESGLQVQEGWLIQQLLGQLQEMLTRLEKGEGLTQQEQWSVGDLLRLATEMGGLVTPLLATRPWLHQVEQVVFGAWSDSQETGVRCSYCGSGDMGPKSERPRWKTYYADDGSQKQVAVYRYYCRNPQCAKGSFTHFPVGLVPYSPYRKQVHLLALQMYAGGYSTYRHTGTALGVCSLTVWRWVSAWG
jgi:hypothetical protein